MKLVIGYLATPGGADALALGLRFARSMGADVEICLILPPARLPALGGSPAGYEKLIAERTDAWIADALAQVPDGVVARGHRYIAESFAEGLISEVVRLQADLLVVGGSGGGLAGSRSLGSVVNELLYSAPVPVAVAPRGLRESRVDRVGGITCAIGERAGADLLLDTAVRFSAAAEAPLRLVSLVALDPVFGSLRGDADAAREHAVAHALRTLEQAKGELPKGFPVTSSVLEGQSVEDAVAQLTWHDGDIIMVGSSRLSAPRRLFLGSTAAKMLRVLDVPMIVVPRDQLSEEDLP
ncbi:universal stress protein UspA [Mycolicibacterium chitae]|uniref:Universal stress protein UspA-like protein n=1 Tax=Mycolicibacterium chitae TaxID=1792 RepID=A0A3S4T2J5_MYCCI|nr:universal stress protein [Mycolicibacterium chitae]MCV7106793.1 universal stress protein [Mycolicibacterium chitae]BBZ05746.1 universal stress protein UspA [Mycolicibacterium chitae]VEG49356.1 universal stress protein UspA-like protein [Mycolicibacterium chitae]